MKTDKPHTFDVIVIGSGGGLKIAIAAASRGMDVALIEHGPIGGTCLNRGCIPSKLMIHPAELIRKIQHASKVGIKLDCEPVIDFPALMQRIQDDVSTISQNLNRMIAENPRITLFTGTASFTEANLLCVDGELLTAPRIFIATGAVPAMPAILGLAETPFWTSTDALRACVLPKSLAVIGASYIAVELGGAYSAFGSQTHFIVRSELLRTADSQIKAAFAEEFARQQIIHKGMRPTAVQHDGKHFRITLVSADDSAESELTTEALLVATGARPATAGMQLDAAGIETDEDGFILTGNHLNTSAEGVWALGDCVGRYMFRHSVNLEAEFLMRHVFDNDPTPLSHGPMPYAVFATPEVAGLGATEDQLVEDEIPFIRGEALYSDSNMGLARQLDQGFCKILVHAHTGALVGAHIVGEDAATLIHTLIPLMYKGGTLEDLLNTVYIHPALPELIRDAARDAKGKCDHA